MGNFRCTHLVEDPDLAINGGPGHPMAAVVEEDPPPPWHFGVKTCKASLSSKKLIKALLVPRLLQETKIKKLTMDSLEYRKLKLILYSELH